MWFHKEADGPTQVTNAQPCLLGSHTKRLCYDNGINGSIRQRLNIIEARGCMSPVLDDRQADSNSSFNRASSRAFSEYARTVRRFFREFTGRILASGLFFSSTKVANLSKIRAGLRIINFASLYNYCISYNYTNFQNGKLLRSSNFLIV